MNGIRHVDWQQAEAAVSAVAWLRDSLSGGHTPRWRPVGLPAADTPLLVHLPPPEPGADELDRWRSTFRRGLCYFRRGPGFIQVKDVRDPDRSAGFVLDIPEVIEVFQRCLRPTPISEVDEDAAEALIEERLMLRVQDQLVTLPYHMRRWPVPAMAV